MSSKTYIKSVEIQVDANKEKRDDITSLSLLWYKAKLVCALDYIALLKSGKRLQRIPVKQLSVGSIRKVEEVNSPMRDKVIEILKSQDENYEEEEKEQEYLLARQINSVGNQVREMMSTWLSKAVNVGKPIIFDMVREFELDDEQKRQLFLLNKRKDWWNCTGDYPDVTEYQEILIERILDKHSWPVIKSFTMRIDSDVCKHEVGENSYDRWIKLWILNGEQIYLPIKTDPYLELMLSQGRQMGTTTITFEDDGSIRFSIPIEFKVDEGAVKDRQANGRAIGLDWGLNSMFATSDGDLLGRETYEWLLASDEELIELQKSLQRQGIPLKKSKRYRNLNNRIRRFIKNEVGRILNKLSKRDISTIVVERLDLRYGGLSRKLNRVISRAGRNALKKKLDDLKERLGITVIEVNPAYTSQRCSGCGLVDKRSRSGETFSCTHCGKEINADVNASRNILERGMNWSENNIYFSKEKCLAVLDKEYRSMWNDDPSRARERKKVKPFHARTAGLRGTSVVNTTLATL